MKKKIDEKTYLIVYELNRLTKEYLQNANDYIKTNRNDLDALFTKNEHNYIAITDTKAIAQYSKEDKAKIEALKQTFVPINEGATTEKIIVSKNDKAINKAQAIIDNIIN